MSSPNSSGETLMGSPCQLDCKQHEEPSSQEISAFLESSFNMLTSILFSVLPETTQAWHKKNISYSSQLSNSILVSAPGAGKRVWGIPLTLALLIPQRCSSLPRGLPGVRHDMSCISVYLPSQSRDGEWRNKVAC